MKVTGILISSLGTSLQILKITKYGRSELRTVFDFQLPRPKAQNFLANESNKARVQGWSQDFLEEGARVPESWVM